MQDKENSSVREYKKRGGLPGVAQQQLMDELLSAKEDSEHLLHNVWQAFQNNDHDLAGRLLLNKLVDSLDDEDSPLKLPALVFVKLQAMELALKEEKENLRSGKDTIQSIRDLALMQVQREEDEKLWLQQKLDSQKKATQSKQEITKKRHHIIIKIVHDVKLNVEPTSITNDSEIARKVRSRIIALRENDSSVFDLFKNIPSVRNIRRVISENT